MAAVDCDMCADAVKSLSSIRGMNIGKSLQKRIKTGKIDEESMIIYDDDWEERLGCLDEKHTEENKVHMKQANKLLAPLEAYAAAAPKPACEKHKKELLDCLQKNPQENLICNDIVVRFKACVDDMMYATSRREEAGLNAKPTYKQKFEKHLS